MPRRGGLLVRNPHFHVWSPDRPDGSPTRSRSAIDRPRAQVAAVERGDGGHRAPRLGETRDVHRAQDAVRRTAAHRPRRGLAYVFLNVRTPPFDDVQGPARAQLRRRPRPRRRARWARRTHAADLPDAAPRACAGTRPRVPSPSTRNPAGTWTGPDLARARRLVAASGTQRHEGRVLGRAALGRGRPLLPLAPAHARLSQPLARSTTST